MESLANAIRSSVDPIKAIVYVQRKAKAVQLWQMLSGNGKAVGIHHSSLREDTRRRVEDDFKSGHLSVIIATVGFGLVSCTIPRQHQHGQHCVPT